MDFKDASLMDFIDVGEKDIMSRASYFGEYADYIRSLRHDSYRRISLNGSSPVMNVFDHHTGDSKDMINLASNDYLNLTRHPETIAAGIEAIKKYGSGAGSVPLLGGTLDIHLELEEKIAKFKGCEDAILYTSGFGSNCGTLLALLQEQDIAILDMLVHASTIDGCKNTNVKFFRHNNLDSLEKVLASSKNNYRTKLVVIDGVYSMDGDISPLDKIIELTKAYGAYLMIDEAHATGVIGENGRGTPEHFNVEGKVDIVSGTFSKALGGVGGFIATSKELVELLRYYSRPYMFSTAPTPQVTGSLIKALEIIENDSERRGKLWRNIKHFKKNLVNLGFNLGNSETAIFPIIIGDTLKVKEATKMLHDRGIYVNPVQYPAVPKRLSRIRMSLMSEHTIDDLNKTLEALEYIGKKLAII